jgi:hypothetical protein
LARPVFYRSINQFIAADPSQDGYTIMARYEGDPSTLIDAMQRQIHVIDPSLAIFNIKTMEEHVHEALFLQRLVGTVSLSSQSRDSSSRLSASTA